MFALPPRPRELRIYPGRLALEQAALGKAGGGAGVTDGRVLFDDLFARFGTVPGRRYAHARVAALLVREVLSASPAPYGALAHEPHAVRAVLRSLAELREAGVTSAALPAARSSPELAAITAVLTRYERALDDRGLHDDADRAREAVLAVTRGAAREVEGVWVEGGGSLFGARLDLLTVFAGAGARVEVRLPYDATREHAFAWPAASLHRLEASQRDFITVRTDDRSGAGPLAALRRAQLGAGVAPGAPVRLLEVGEPADHARAAAGVVTSWLRAGVPPQEVVVACGDLDVHGPEVVAELAALGVRARLRSGVALARTGPGRAVIAALGLADRGFPREDVIDLWLALGRTLEVGAEAWWPDRVARLLRDSGVRSARVGGYRARLEAHARASRRAGLPEAAGVVAGALEALVQELSALPREAAVDAQLAAAAALASSLLGEGGGFGGAFRDVGALGSERAVVAARAREGEARVAVGEVLLSLAQAARVVGPGVPMTRRELAALVELELSAQRLRAEAGGAAVAVVRPADLCEASFSRVLLVGVDPDVFPAPAAVDPVLTDDLRQEINDLLGPRLLQQAPLSGRAPLRADARDRWSWLEALASARDELAVTFGGGPAGSGEGRSELVTELLRTLDGGAAERWRPPHLELDLQGLGPARLAWAAGLAARPPQAAERAALGAALGGSAAGRLASIERRARAGRALERAPFGQGKLGGDERQALERHLLSTVLTASAVDALGICAFRFFAKGLLHLEAASERSLGADEREQGSLAHAALEVIYDDLRSRGGLAAARREPDAARARAIDVLGRERAHLLAEVVLHPRLEPAAVEAAHDAALALFGRDLEGDDPREPVSLEYEFGDKPTSAAPALEVPAPADPARVLRVRGKIDRIDRVGARLEAVDYKRSTKKRPAGRHFQIPVYLAVALRDFGGGVVEVAGFWQGFRDARRVEAVTAAAPAGFLATLAADVHARLDRVAGGDVSADPVTPSDCDRCDFAGLCRYRVVGGEDDES